MLRVGLTGGIGSGKSTVAQRFGELGAVVIDADQLAREVVAPGSTGLTAIHERFGEAVLAADGSLDRGALGELVFSDPRARKDLEAITHPLIRARTRALVQAAAPEQIVVHDVPLLVELDLAAEYHLTVVVGADEDVRMERLTMGRGMTVAEAQARIAAQASDGGRRTAADVWLDNNGTVQELIAQVDLLWQDRILAFNDNLMTGSRSRRPEVPTLVPYDDSWPQVAARLIARISMSLSSAGLGEAVVAVEHIGSTSVPGLIAKDVIDLQIAVRRIADGDAPEFVTALADKGFPRSEGNNHDNPHAWAPDPSSWRKRFHGSADPGRIVHLHVREVDGPGWRYALLFRDWLRAEAYERDAYAEHKAQLARSFATTTEYVEAKEPWFVEAFARADAWARHTGWTVQ
jgi:dephospho-CoA kinase